MRGFFRTLLLTIGILATLMGLLWIGQGMGYVHWPKSSFMISQMTWAYRGMGLAIGGVLVAMLSRRI